MRSSDEFKQILKEFLDREDVDGNVDDEEFFDQIRQLTSKAKSNKDMFERWRELCGDVLQSDGNAN